MTTRFRLFVLALLLLPFLAVPGPQAWARDEGTLDAAEREQLRQQIREAHRQRMHARHHHERQQARLHRVHPPDEVQHRLGPVERDRLHLEISHDERLRLRRQLREHHGHSGHAGPRVEHLPAHRRDGVVSGSRHPSASPVMVPENLDASARGAR